MYQNKRVQNILYNLNYKLNKDNKYIKHYKKADLVIIFDKSLEIVEKSYVFLNNEFNEEEFNSINNAFDLLKYDLYLIKNREQEYEKNKIC